MTPDEEKEVLGLMRAAREKDRGHASFFGWGLDRDLEELGVVRSLAEALEAMGQTPFDKLQSRHRPNDPPDVEGVDTAGARVAFEVTELVDGASIRAFKANRPWEKSAWDRAKFDAALRDRLASKAARRDKLKGAPYPGGYVIVVHCDEPELSASTVEQYLEGRMFPELVGVDRAFLLLSYDPRVEGYPVFELLKP